MSATFADTAVASACAALPLSDELAALELAVDRRDWSAAAIADARLRLAATTLLGSAAPGAREALVSAIARHRAITDRAAVAAGGVRDDLALLDRGRLAVGCYRAAATLHA